MATAEIPVAGAGVCLYFGDTGDNRGPRKHLARSCDIAGLEIQGEGVDWLDGERLLLTSEKGVLPAGTIHVIARTF